MSEATRKQQGMMLLSPLQLEQLTIKKFLIEGQEGDCQEPSAEEPLTIETGQVVRHRTEAARWRISLRLRTPARGQAQRPYKIDVELAGFFRLSGEFDEQEAARLVAVNGSSVLYSAAREYVWMVTSRGPWGPYQLPTVNFSAMDVTLAKKTGHR